MESPTTFLARIAARSAASWLALGDRLFPGEAIVDTAHRTYVFRNGRFVSRTSKRERSFEAPASMRGLRLIGFVFDDGTGWSLSPRTRFECHAVLWRPGPISTGGVGSGSFILTSRVLDFSVDEPDSGPAIVRSPFQTIPPDSYTGVARARGFNRPPPIVPPSPPSMTRLHASQTVAPASVPH